MSEPRKKANHVGAPAIFELELACRQINEAFGGGIAHCYLVGSALDRADRRDIDVRLIISDEEFQSLFPHCVDPRPSFWEHDARWLLMTTALSEYLSKRTGLSIDFQFQAQTAANEFHKGPRHALGMRMSPR